jgi:hypothetical protein
MTVPGSKEEVLVAVSGGMLEVQPTHITVLADTAIRGEDLDEARANEARAAEESLQHATDDLSTAKAHAALAAGHCPAQGAGLPQEACALKARERFVYSCRLPLLWQPFSFLVSKEFAWTASISDPGSGRTRMYSAKPRFCT